MTDWVTSMDLSVVSRKRSFPNRLYADCVGSLEKEIEIVYDLAQRVLRFENMLVEASDICGQIDRQASNTFEITEIYLKQSYCNDSSSKLLQASATKSSTRECYQY